MGNTPFIPGLALREHEALYSTFRQILTALRRRSNFATPVRSIRANGHNSSFKFWRRITITTKGSSLRNNPISNSGLFRSTRIPDSQRNHYENENKREHRTQQSSLLPPQPPPSPLNTPKTVRCSHVPTPRRDGTRGRQCRVLSYCRLVSAPATKNTPPFSFTVRKDEAYIRTSHKSM